MKIARVSGAQLELFERDLTLEIKGTDKCRRAARKYSECVMAQRVGSVRLEDDDSDRDRTVIRVPQEAVGFVTGKGGNFLRTIEHEWGVIMFFVEFNRDDRAKETEKLAIFGPQRGRKGAELKVMSAVEQKKPGYYNQDDFENDPEADGDWGVETKQFRNPDECSYALGKMGATRKKLEAASECILQYCGNTIVFAGMKKERTRGREYMRWLFDQLDGPVSITSAEERSDCTIVKVPNDTVGYITGARRAALSGIEAEWGVFCFFTDFGPKDDRNRKGNENLHVFGPERNRRGAELKVLSSIETKNPGFVTRNMEETISRRSGFDSDCFRLKDEDVAYALGQKGATRMKLQTSSHCILQYIGNYAVLAGTKMERERCREFIQWLLAQRRGSVTVADISGRQDVTEMHIPKQCRGYVTGNRGSALRQIEHETGTYLFMALDRDGEERLLIFSTVAGDRVSEKGRMGAERAVNNLVQDRMSGGDQYGGGRGYDRRDSRRRGRSPPRGRRDSRRRSSRRR